ncbi:hypothetical protein HAX54_023342 [Datura stramonium]|uniref:Uncharacterized protein n=1 Tax=Datura stramonium TaxID=4076 RepID=A0ABS8UYB9_DATST|nr:hypothetical protein [Datura stramonium]
MLVSNVSSHQNGQRLSEEGQERGEIDVGCFPCKGVCGMSSSKITPIEEQWPLLSTHWEELCISMNINSSVLKTLTRFPNAQVLGIGTTISNPKVRQGDSPSTAAIMRFIAIHRNSQQNHLSTIIIVDTLWCNLALWKKWGSSTLRTSYIG